MSEIFAIKCVLWKWNKIIKNKKLLFNTVDLINKQKGK